MSVVPLRTEARSRGVRMLRTALGVSVAGWLDDPATIEVMLNPDGRLWIDRLGEGVSDTGTLTLADVKANPHSAPLNNRLNDHARNIRSARALNRTVISLGGATALEFGGFLNGKSLYHPIFKVIDYETVDWGGFTRLTGEAGSFAWTLGAQAQFGPVAARKYVRSEEHT